MNVYLICSEFDNYKLYKIGYTRRTVEERINDFRTGNASDFYIVDTFESIWATKIESYLKKFFKSKQINGEWFKLNDNDISLFRDKCKIIHENFEIITTQNTYYKERGKF